MAFHRPKHVLMYVFLFILSTMALSLIYKTIQISEETKKEATLIEESNKFNYVELPNGQYLYQRKDSGSFTPHAFCIAGSRMNRLLSPELFNLTNTYFLQVSDPDLFIWGYYDTDTFDIDQLFNLFGHRIAGLHLSKYDPKNMEFFRSQMISGPRDNQISFLYTMHMCWQLLQNHVIFVKNQPYNVIMSGRADMEWLSPVDLSLYETDKFLPELVLYTPPAANSWKDTDAVKQKPATGEKNDGVLLWWGAHPGFNDQCAIGSSRSMDLYMHVLYELLKNPKYGSFLEMQLYAAIVETYEFNVRRADMRFDLSRG